MIHPVRVPDGCPCPWRGGLAPLGIGLARDAVRDVDAFLIPESPVYDPLTSSPLHDFFLSPVCTAVAQPVSESTLLTALVNRQLQSGVRTLSTRSLPIQGRYVPKARSDEAISCRA